MSLLLGYDERLYGAHFEPAGWLHRGTVTLDLSVRGALHRLVLERSVSVEGVLDAPPIAHEVPVTGAIVLSRSGGVLEVDYRFSFEDADRRLHFLKAKRRIELLRLQPSLTVLSGSIEQEDGAMLARLTLRYDMRADLGRSLSSLRLHVG